jgi:hypothetical protein
MGWYRNVIFFVFALPFSLCYDYWLHCRGHFKIVVVPVGHGGEREVKSERKRKSRRRLV